MCFLNIYFHNFLTRFPDYIRFLTNKSKNKLNLVHVCVSSCLSEGEEEELVSSQLQVSQGNLADHIRVATYRKYVDGKLIFSGCRDSN